MKKDEIKKAFEFGVDEIRTRKKTEILVKEYEEEKKLKEENDYICKETGIDWIYNTDEPTIVLIE